MVFFRSFSLSCGRAGNFPCPITVHSSNTSSPKNDSLPNFTASWPILLSTTSFGYRFIVSIGDIRVTADDDDRCTSLVLSLIFMGKQCFAGLHNCGTEDVADGGDLDGTECVDGGDLGGTEYVDGGDLGGTEYVDGGRGGGTEYVDGGRGGGTEYVDGGRGGGTEVIDGGRGGGDSAI